MIYLMILVVYLIMGYFMIRYIHKNIEKLEHLGYGFIAIIIWPMIVIFFLIDHHKPNWTDLFFGKGKE